MEIKRLDANAVRQLYDTRMKRDFPPSELRPYASMKSLMDEGLYLCFAYEDEGDAAAYAYFVASGGAALLDYYAVDEARRGQGVGGKFLTGLRGVSQQFQAPYILIEVESVESARTPAQVEERERRIRFYGHSGCRPTGVYSHLFGVEYQILYLPLSGGEGPSDQEVKSALERLYRLIVNPLVQGDPQAYARVCQCFFGSQPLPAQ